MSNFDDVVKKARSKLDPENPKKRITKPVQYLLLEREYATEIWPTEFEWPPNVGDMVESQSGRTLKINSITHKAGGVMLTLGKDMGGVSASGGGGIGQKGPLEFIG